MADEEVKVQEDAAAAVLAQDKKLPLDAKMIDKEKKDQTNMNGNTGENAESEKDTEFLKKKATQLLLQGKRNIIIHDFQAAVAALAESCQLFSKIYDEQADEMGDPYYYYGKALFETARNESEVLGDQVQEEDDDEDEDNAGGDEDEDEENKEEASKEAKPETNNDGAGDEKGANASETSREDISLEKETATEEENEDVNDLQLSWEYLELAKLIYQRKASSCKATAIKLSEVYLTLGENGLESANYLVAIDDMKQALALQQSNLPEEDRRIAETYYHLGVAYSLARNFDEAISSFRSAVAQLRKKIASLNARKEAGDGKTEEEEKDAFYTMDGEIEDINSIIKEIEEKITDMNDYKSQMREELLKQVMPDEAGSSSNYGCSASTSSASSSVPATDISHLVRKKRKNENDSENGNECKRPKQENGV